MSEQATQSQSGNVSQETTNNFSIPAEYQDRGWAKTVKSYDDLWKGYDNTQSLIGKRPAGIPSQDAPPEEWDKFYNALRPEKADQYALPDKFDGMPEDIDLKPSMEKMRSMAHKIGLTPKQAETLWADYMGMELDAMGKANKSKQAREKELDAEFDKLSTGLFGDSFSSVAQEAKEYLTSVLPPELSGAVAELEGNPKALLAMIKVVHDGRSELAKVKKEYGAEDKLKSGSQAGGQSINEINAKLVDAKARWNKEAPFSPNRKVIAEEIESLRGILAKSVK